MAKGKGSIKGWITRNGVHVPIYGEYTVRGGVEPTAKGSKFKKKNKFKDMNMEQLSKTDVKKLSSEELEQLREVATESRANHRMGADVLDQKVHDELDRREGKKEESNFAKHEDYTKNKEQKKKWQDISNALGDYDANNDTEGKKPVTKAEEKPRTSADNREERIAALKEKINAKTQQAVEEYRKDDPNYKDGKYLKEQASSRYNDKMTTPYKDLNDKQKSFVKELAEERAGHKLSDEGVQFYQDLENDERSIRQAQIKERESKQLREIPKEPADVSATKAIMSKEAAQGLGKLKEKYSTESSKSSIEDKIVQGLRKRGVPESAVASEALSLKIGYAEGSVAPEELKSLGVTSDEMKLLQSNEKISAMSRYASGKDKTRFIDPMGNLMETRNRSAYEKNTGMDFSRDIGKGNIQDAIDREKVERAKVYDRVKGNPEGTTKSPMVVKDMTPSGLRSAWETATGSEKTKISSELRRRGYTYVGGKWVKA